MFPQQEEPKGDPRNWSEEDMRRWLDNVSFHRHVSVETTRKYINKRLREDSILARQPHARSCLLGLKPTCEHLGHDRIKRTHVLGHEGDDLFFCSIYHSSELCLMRKWAYEVAAGAVLANFPFPLLNRPLRLSVDIVATSTASTVTACLKDPTQGCSITLISSSALSAAAFASSLAASSSLAA